MLSSNSKRASQNYDSCIKLRLMWTRPALVVVALFSSTIFSFVNERESVTNFFCTFQVCFSNFFSIRIKSLHFQRSEMFCQKIFKCFFLWTRSRQKITILPTNFGYIFDSFDVLRKSTDRWYLTTIPCMCVCMPIDRLFLVFFFG